jgi:hypothetical protein
MSIASVRASMRRRDVLVWLGSAITWSFTASHACSAAVPAKIGWLKIQGPRHTPDQLKAFRSGMWALGQIEGRDYALVERYAEDKEARLPALATRARGAGCSSDFGDKPAVNRGGRARYQDSADNRAL